MQTRVEEAVQDFVRLRLMFREDGDCLSLAMLPSPAHRIRSVQNSQPNARPTLQVQDVATAMPPRHSGLLVLDDFYQDWRAIREEAVALSYQDVPNVRLSYRHAKPNRLLQANGSDAIIGLIGEKYRESFLESHFFLGTKEAARENLKRGSWIHFDRCRWIGVVFLNQLHQCRGGTTFYRHRATGAFRWEQALKLGPKAQEQIALDSADIDAWDVLLHVAMLPNRLLLFDSRQFHQATEYFGSNSFDARLTQHFYFREIPDQDMSLDWGS